MEEVNLRVFNVIAVVAFMTAGCDDRNDRKCTDELEVAMSSLVVARGQEEIEAVADAQGEGTVGWWLAAELICTEEAGGCDLSPSPLRAALEAHERCVSGQ